MTAWAACASCGHLGVLHPTTGPCAAHLWAGDCDCGGFEAVGA